MGFSNYKYATKELKVGSCCLFCVFFYFLIIEFVAIFAPRNRKKLEGGHKKSPILLVKILITQEQILTLANNHLKDGSVFVTGIKINSDNSIQVFIDGDNGVTIADCVALSRTIEGNLNRDQLDFSLDVSSHGAVAPLVMPRQYNKHIGRTLEVKLKNSDKVEGILTEISETNFVLEYTTRENKPIGKGKINVVKQTSVNFSEIKEAKIKLKY